MVAHTVESIASRPHTDCHYHSHHDNLEVESEGRRVYWKFVAALAPVVDVQRWCWHLERWWIGIGWCCVWWSFSTVGLGCLFMERRCSQRYLLHICVWDGRSKKSFFSVNKLGVSKELKLSIRPQSRWQFVFYSSVNKNIKPIFQIYVRLYW